MTIRRSAPQQLASAAARAAEERMLVVRIPWLGLPSLPSEMSEECIGFCIGGPLDGHITCFDIVDDDLFNAPSVRDYEEGYVLVEDDRHHPDAVWYVPAGCEESSEDAIARRWQEYTDAEIVVSSAERRAAFRAEAHGKRLTPRQLLIVTAGPPPVRRSAAEIPRRK